ncbi:MAG: transglutaminase domain-containing protein, partial [Thermoflexibacteraceae bacterium]
MNRFLQYSILYILWQFAFLPFVTAQNLPTPPTIQFGKVDRADLEMQVYSKDSTATALVLYDKGLVSYKGDYQGFRLVYERHLRIKILSPAAYIWTKFEIPVYKNSTNGQGETLVNLEGYTHLLNADGKVVRHKLESQDLFQTKVSPDVTLNRFAMPFADVGAVVEYKYTLESDMIFNLPTWEFQRGIPTLWSEYEAKIPEYLAFSAYKQGDLALDIEKIEKYQDYFGLQGSIYTADIYKNRYAMQNVPAFLPTPDLQYPQLLVNRMEFFLDSFKFPWMSKTEQVPSDWGSIHKQLQKEEAVNDFLKKSGESKEFVRNLTDTLPNNYEKMKKLLQYVQNNVLFTGETSRVPSLKSANFLWAMKEKQGNTADMNLLLVALLRQAKLNANYVVLSTKDAGHPNVEKVIFNKLNMVVASVEIDGKVYLLDASDFDATPEKLPQRCKNRKGLL